MPLRISLTVWFISSSSSSIGRDRWSFSPLDELVLFSRITSTPSYSFVLKASSLKSGDIGADDTGWIGVENMMAGSSNSPRIS
jgi:hypothetical protein